MKKNLLLWGLLFSVTFVNAQLSGLYKQSFEDSIFPPQHWLRLSSSGSGAWNHDLNYGHWGTKCVYSSGTIGSKHSLIMPKFAIVSGDSLIFWITSSVASENELSVHASFVQNDREGDTIAILSLPDLHNKWVRYAFDLSNYAGKAIYIYFSRNCLAANNIIRIDNVAIENSMPAKDISAWSINVDQYQLIDSTIAPTATFQNQGAQTQTFNVTLTAGDYTSTKTITSLLPLDTQTVTFNKLKLPSQRAYLTFTAYSSLTGDAYPADDTLKKSVSVDTVSSYYTQGFEGTVFPPPGWSTGMDKSPDVWVHTSAFSHGGMKSAYSGHKSSGADSLFTSKFTVRPGDSLTCWVSGGNGSEPLNIMVNTDASHAVNLANYNNSNLLPANTWKRLAFDLSTFSDQTIYITFIHSEGTFRSGFYIDDVTLGTPPSKDVSALSIDSVPAYFSADSTIKPKATFQNAGSKTQTFNVTLTTGTYSSTKTITSLLPQYTQQVSFDNLVLPTQPTDLVFTAYASLAGDTNTVNDTIRKTCSVLKTFANNGWIKSRYMPLPASNDYYQGIYENAVTSYYGGVTPNDSAYIFSMGGISGVGGPFNYNEEFNLKTKTWKYLKPMPVTVSGGSAFYYKGKIYYIGGQQNNSYCAGGDCYTAYSTSDSVLIYDIATDTWGSGLPAPVGVTEYAGCQYHDSLFYVIGGFYHAYDEFFDSLKIFNSVYVYNAAADTWATATELPETTSANGAGVANNTIIVTGGYNDSTHQSVGESYSGVINPDDPTKITWKQIKNYPDGGITGVGAVGINNPNVPLVYFTGGYYADDTTGPLLRKTTFAYNVATGQWEIGPDKLTSNLGINGFAPFIFNDTLYIATIGGYTGPVSQDSTSNEWLVIGATSGVLAERFVSFTATLQNNKTLLNWKVSEDGSGSYYVIQRAADAQHFTDISSNISAGKGSGIKSYNGNDELPLKGYNYYRIKMVGIDGSITYSPIKAVNNSSSGGITASIYPNPTHGLLNVVLQNNSNNTVISIAISDIAGRRIINENKAINGSLNLSYNLKPGTYVINLVSKDGTWKESRKIVVE